jgi:hypothetical protein
MRTKTMAPLLPALALALALALACGEANGQANPAHAHIGHVLEGFSGTPEGQGLLPTALAEARVAAQHAGLAARDLSNLAAMQQHTAHVAQAIDPSYVAQGPGMGYGVKRAAEGIVAHVGLAAGGDGASANVAMHAEHVTAAARNVVERAEGMVALARQIEAAGTAAEAAPLVEQLRDLAEQLVSGHDASGDGRVGWQDGGLEQVEQHMNLMRRGEGID